MKNDVEIGFRFWAATVPPKEISIRTGIEADVCFIKGERNSKLVLPRENLWAIRTHVESDYVEDHWCDLERMLGSKKEILKEIAQTGVAKITIIINSSLRIPPIAIPPEMSAFAAFLNIEIEIAHFSSWDIFVDKDCSLLVCRLLPASVARSEL